MAANGPSAPIAPHRGPREPRASPPPHDFTARTSKRRREIADGAGAHAAPEQRPWRRAGKARPSETHAQDGTPALESEPVIPVIRVQRPLSRSGARGAAALEYAEWGQTGSSSSPPEAEAAGQLPPGDRELSLFPAGARASALRAHGAGHGGPRPNGQRAPGGGDSCAPADRNPGAPPRTTENGGRQSGAFRPAQNRNLPGPIGPEKMPVKTSLGVILCRKNPKTRRLQVLLVHKRYTYAFSEFVHGRYTRGRISTPGGAAHRSVSALLDRMTQEELIDLWSLDFGQMWYRIWLTRDNKELYNKKHAKFQTAFMREDGGAALRRLISQARANGVLLWEVPKGRRLGAREPDILCAVRELREEAGVDKREYHIIPEAKRRAVYTSAGTRYVCVYYVAVANPHLSASSAEGHPSSRHALRAVNQMAETSETRWFDIEQIRVLGELGADDSGHLEALVGPAFRLVKKHLRGRACGRVPCGP